MSNPYETAFMRRRKRAAGPLYKALRVLLFPKYLVWKLSEALPKVQMKLGERFSFLAKPAHSITGFTTAWCNSRPWGKLWAAMPILIILVVAFTAFFVSVNKNRGKAHREYYQGALKAMHEGDFKESDRLFTKLIDHPSYKDNDQVLYHALVSAHRNKNASRVTSLQYKLVEERQYERAKRWLITKYITKSSPSKADSEKYLEMAEEMIEVAPNAANASYWHEIAAKLFVSLGKKSEALEILERDVNIQPQGRLLQYQVFISAGDEQSAVEVLEKMLAYIELEDPDEKEFFNDKVEGLAYLAVHVPDPVGVFGRAVGVVERKRALDVEEYQKYSMWLSRLHVRMFQALLRKRDKASRRLAFKHLDKSLAGDLVSEHSGPAALGAVSYSSGYGLLSAQLLEVAVKDGGCSVQVVLALEALLSGDEHQVKFHVKLANAANPLSMKTLLLAARALAERSMDSRRGMRSGYQKSLDLLDIIAKEAPDESVSVMLDKCYVYALKKDWPEVIEQLEGKFQNLEGQQLLDAYAFLVKSYNSLGSVTKAKEYQRSLTNELNLQKLAK